MVTASGLFFVASILYVLQLLWSRRRIYMISWKLPGPFAWPLIGNCLSLRKIEDNVYYGYRICQKYSTPLRFWQGPKMYIGIDNADDIEAVLKSPHCLNKDDIYQYVRESLAVDGLFTLEASVWKRHRKYVSPSFGLGYVYGNMSVFNKHLNELVESMKTNVNQKPFDLRLCLNSCTCDMILETTLGMEVDRKERTLYSDYLIQIQKIAAMRMFQPWYRFAFIWKFTKFPAIVNKFTELQMSIFNKLIKSRLRSGTDRPTVIDNLIKVATENEDFSLNDVKDESNTVMMAGADTTSLTIATTLLLLAIYPEHQERVLKELQSILGNDTTNITRDDVEKMEYTEMCLKETLRLFPMVAMVVRQTTAKFRLKTVDIELPANTPIVIAVYPIHHRKEYWGENVEDFVPERFTPENEKKMHPFQYLPFMAGPRNCVGYKYAMVVMKTALAKILMTYRFTTPMKREDVTVNMAINLNFLNRHMVQIQKR